MGVVPSQGDFITVDFDPQSGHEQQGRRPALVLSNQTFNKLTGLLMVCPLTNTDRRSTLHVPVTGRTQLTGFVMAEQIKSLDYKSRKAKVIGHAPAEVVAEVKAIVEACLE